MFTACPWFPVYANSTETSRREDACICRLDSLLSQEVIQNSPNCHRAEWRSHPYPLGRRLHCRKPVEAPTAQGWRRSTHCWQLIYWGAGRRGSAGDIVAQLVTTVVEATTTCTARRWRRRWQRPPAAATATAAAEAALTPVPAQRRTRSGGAPMGFERHVVPARAFRPLLPSCPQAPDPPETRGEPLLPAWAAGAGD